MTTTKPAIGVVSLPTYTQPTKTESFGQCVETALKIITVESVGGKMHRRSNKEIYQET